MQLRVECFNLLLLFYYYLFKVDSEKQNLQFENL